MIAYCLIGKQNNRQRFFPQGGPTKRKSTNQTSPANTPDYFPEYQFSGQRCMYCETDCKDIKTFVKCSTCDVYLRVVTEKILLLEVPYSCVKEISSLSNSLKQRK